MEWVQLYSERPTLSGQGTAMSEPEIERCMSPVGVVTLNPWARYGTGWGYKGVTGRAEAAVAWVWDEVAVLRRSGIAEAEMGRGNRRGGR